MKPLRASLIACVIAAFAGPAFAQYLIKPQVMPVVVQVNAQGKVTDILPSEHLRPTAKTLLIRQLDAWIAKPASVKGKPVASTFIVEVAMHARPRADGKFDVNYVYVKSLPMPFSGAVFWRHVNGNFELQLVDASTAAPMRTWSMPPEDDFAPARAARATVAAASGQRAASVSSRAVQPGRDSAQPVQPVAMMAPAAARAGARSTAARIERP